MLTHERLVELIEGSIGRRTCTDADVFVGCSTVFSCKECAEHIVRSYEESIRKDEREKIIANIKTHFTKY